MAGFLRGNTANSPGVQRTNEILWRLVAALASAIGAVILWLIYRSVSFNLGESEKAVGYVDPMTQAGILFGNVAMIVGIVVLAAIALWLAIVCIRLFVRG
ncbi:MAG: hypothetical protein JO078_02280 [Candidatus Eremiobacteraeota bacterium]|nr:hypothetical protein [Candidatus Eremiobacteraeota bacterium]MBV9055625.1 hypothetical protein [Candidatus Eremiobacteraeota bacterium]MBV9698930.1 hypothetical protein [Candidatus Eremiobacteraeota bacterium]